MNRDIAKGQQKLIMVLQGEKKKLYNNINQSLDLLNLTVFFLFFSHFIMSFGFHNNETLKA